MIMLSGCSEDAMIANDLRGIWRGEIESEYYSHRWGHVTEYTEVEYEFYENPYDYSVRRGKGVEYSYIGQGRGTACRFEYEVRNRDIYLYFEDGADIVITDYRLNNRIFGGDFRDARTGDYIARFSLVKVSNYYSNNVVWAPKRK